MIANRDRVCEVKVCEKGQISSGVRWTALTFVPVPVGLVEDEVPHPHPRRQSPVSSVTADRSLLQVAERCNRGSQADRSRAHYGPPCELQEKPCKSR